MTRRVFFSFHFQADCWRASQVRNIGAIEGNAPCSDNAWEKVKQGGDAAIKRWIDREMFGKSCLVVLVGSGTAGRKWITHEIVEAWNKKMGVVGVRVNQLLDVSGSVASSGANPFEHVKLGDGTLSSVVKLHDPWSIFGSTGTYSNIKLNLAEWIEEAIDIRLNYGKKKSLFDYLVS